jgi:hypothetical protein
LDPLWARQNPTAAGRKALETRILTRLFVSGEVLRDNFWSRAQVDRKMEITTDYSYIHTNPLNSRIVPTSRLNGMALPVPFSSASTIRIEGELEGCGRKVH